MALPPREAPAVRGLTSEIRPFERLSDPNDIHRIETTTKSPNRADDIARHSYAGERESSYRIANRWATIRSRGTAMKPATRQSIAGITVALSLAAAIPWASRAQQNPRDDPDLMPRLGETSA